MTKPPVFSDLDAEERILVSLRDGGPIDGPSGRAVRVLAERCELARGAALAIVRILHESGQVVREVNATKTNSIALSHLGKRRAKEIEVPYVAVERTEPSEPRYGDGARTRHLAPMPNGRGSSVEGPEPREPQCTSDLGEIYDSPAVALDPELEAMQACVDAIGELDDETERGRVVGYLILRFGGPVPPAGMGADA